LSGALSAYGCTVRWKMQSDGAFLFLNVSFIQVDAKIYIYNRLSMFFSGTFSQFVVSSPAVGQCAVGLGVYEEFV
jgi:hypothetical protein